MEQKTARRLGYWYYGMMVLAVLVATLAYMAVMRGWLQVTEPLSASGQVIQYVVIFDVLLTVPIGLYGFSQACKRIREIEDEAARHEAYYKWGIARIVLVSNAMVLGMGAFYLLGGYQPMLFVAAIAAIGWYFTKPTVRKVEIELTQPAEGQETY